MILPRPPEFNPRLSSVPEHNMTFTDLPLHLSDALARFAFKKVIHDLNSPLAALPVYRLNGMSGYHYSLQNKMVAEVRFGLTISGYFVIQTQMMGTPSRVTSHYYQDTGEFAFSENAFSQPIAHCTEQVMEAGCPIVNHIYNILCSIYTEATSGTANTKRAHTLEQALNQFSNSNRRELGISKGYCDEAVLRLTHKMMAIDLDPVLTWKERHQLIKAIKQERTLLINSKSRAHHLWSIRYKGPLLIQNLKNVIVRFAKRPVSNFFGMMDRILFDPLRWFSKVVRGNMGYSIALGIYSPFTFFFITQPMNPHAMWAVGKVRSAYIEVTDKIKNGFGSHASNTVQFYQTPTAAPAVGAVATTSTAALSLPPPSNPQSFNPNQAKFGGILLGAEVPSVNEQTWDERMSNFKAMQISYEENLEISSRFGRLEQMETQLNWPLIVESTWLETERYLDQIKLLLNRENEYRPDFIVYLHHETERANQMQLYLWDRNVRFILDHPFTLMDQSKEQTLVPYYVGRAFVMLREMTQTLKARNSGLPLPKGYEAIDQLATHFQDQYQSDSSLLERLKRNSKLFSQKDLFDTQELRSYMKREWEVLYLLQNHAQEASNNGLQLYNWSIRNAVFIAQSIFSAKREELTTIEPLFKRDGTPSPTSVATAVKRIDSQYEALFHMMVLEYTSIRKEIGESLKKDIEATQRRSLITSLENFLKERESLLKSVKVL